MWRRPIRFALVASWVLGGLSGCLPDKSSSNFVRRESEHPGLTREEARTSSIEEVETDRPEGLKNFFKPTRRPGALSSEAAEIERSLGVGGY